jgi:4-amino-4-deoxy-L-arabinose transferase-like glycosyltransferase
MEAAVERIRAAICARWFLPAVLALAAILRLVHLHQLHATVYFENLDLDPLTFDLWGQRVADGELVGERAFFVDPLYPYVLGGIYAVFGHSLLAVRLVQCVLGVTTVFLTARLGRALHGPAIGNVAALVVAVYKPSIFYEAEVEKTVLAVCLFQAGVLLSLRPSLKARAGAGVLLGLAGLARANIFILIPIVLVYAHVASSGTWRRRLAHPALVLAGVIAVLIPVFAHNRRAGGEWALTTSAGQNLYIGNNPLNDTGGYCQLPFVRPTPLFEEDDFRAAAEAEVGRPMTANQVSSFWVKKTLAGMADDPAFAAHMMGRKLALLVNDYELPDNQDMYFLERDSIVMAAPLPTAIWIFPLAALGLVLGLRRRDTRYVAILVVAFGASIVLFFVQSRFRMPAIPLLAVFAAAGGAWLFDVVRANHRRAIAIAAVALAAVAFVCLRAPANQDRTLHRAISWQNLAVLHARQGHHGEAIAAYHESLRLVPHNIGARCDLGMVALDGGDPGARAELVACVAADPEHADAWVSLGRAHEAAGAPTDARVAYERALELTDSAAAAVALERINGGR